MIWVLLILLVVVAVLAYGSISIASGLYIKSLCYSEQTGSAIAITFDDGVDPVITPKVLDVLERYGAKATFFIIGEKAEKYPQIVREIYDRGHSIGNHSFYHKATFPLGVKSKIVSEIESCNSVIERILNDKVILFRPPFGVTNPMIARAVRSLELISVGWSIRSFDTLGQPLDRVYKRITRHIKAGKVILLHDNREGAEVLLEKILQYTTTHALRCVTVNELFKINDKNE